MASKKLTKVFRSITSSITRRVNKYPDTLPRIDWNYYRTNVRTEYIKMVDEFEKKYEELNKVFDGRHELDTSKYYYELEKKKEEVKTDINKYISESNKRIKEYEAEIDRIRNLIPYEQMTAEEFVEFCPDKAEFFPCCGKPSFWPHTPEEQIPDAAGIKLQQEGALTANGTPSAPPTLPVVTQCFPSMQPTIKPVNTAKDPTLLHQAAKTETATTNVVYGESVAMPALPPQPTPGNAPAEPATKPAEVVKEPSALQQAEKTVMPITKVAEESTVVVPKPVRTPLSCVETTAPTSKPENDAKELATPQPVEKTEEPVESKVEQKSEPPTENSAEACVAEKSERDTDSDTDTDKK